MSLKNIKIITAIAILIAVNICHGACMTANHKIVELTTRKTNENVRFSVPLDILKAVTSEGEFLITVSYPAMTPFKGPWSDTNVPFAVVIKKGGVYGPFGAYTFNNSKPKLIEAGPEFDVYEGTISYPLHFIFYLMHVEAGEWAVFADSGKDSAAYYYSHNFIDGLAIEGWANKSMGKNFAEIDRKMVNLVRNIRCN